MGKLDNEDRKTNDQFFHLVGQLYDLKKRFDFFERFTLECIVQAESGNEMKLEFRIIAFIVYRESRNSKNSNCFHFNSIARHFLRKKKCF